MLHIAIIGRPNVGKSTLFNRLVGKKMAIVENVPGVTRDWRRELGKIDDLPFFIIDTAGLEKRPDQPLADRMTEHTMRLAAQIDLILFVVDGLSGLMPDDFYYAEWARKLSKPVILLVNKCENQKTHTALYEAYQLGLGKPIALSAEHKEGFHDLYDHLKKYSADLSENISEESSEKGLHLAIIGRPNVGKSTLINSLLNEERLLTGAEAGLTRDAISVPYIYKDQLIRLVDTAGLRKKARIKDKLDSLASKSTLNAVQYAEIVILVIDGLQPLEKQELHLARHVAEEGRGLILAVNKWDLIEDKQKCLKHVFDQLSTSLTQVKGLLTVPISGLYKKNIHLLLDNSFKLYKEWNKRISTGRLNEWLKTKLDQHAPPAASDGRRIKIRYMTQIKTRPPTFALFSSHLDIPMSYQRFLINGLREEIGFECGVPIRLIFRKKDNPYV